MFGVYLDILDIDWSGDRMGEDRRRVQKIFCSQTPRAGGDHWLLIIIINFDVDDWWMMMMDLISSGERDQSSWVSKTMELWERKSWGEIFPTLKQIDSIF